MHLQIVALPLGNPLDLSPRAKASLENADIIICEDTRKLKALLGFLNLSVSAKFLAVPVGREEEFPWKDFVRENSKKNISLVSDAGTPLINDPGRFLLEEVQKNNGIVEAIPGPSAPILAYQWSGGFGLPPTFAGFVPRKKIKDFFLKNEKCKTLIFFETKHHFEDTFLALIEMGWGERQVFVAREMTKTYEEGFRGTVQQALEWLKKRSKENDGSLGELTFVLQGSGEELSSIEPISIEDIQTLRMGSTKEASKIMAKILNQKASEMYQEILQWKK